MINRLKIMDLRMLPLAVLSMVMVLLAACGGNGRRTSPYVDVNTDFNHQLGKFFSIFFCFLAIYSPPFHLV